jgi:hypothetical protein
VIDDTTDVHVIHMQSTFELRVGGHSHKCPECYQSKVCRSECSIAPDLKEGEADHGSPATCEDCCRQLAVKLNMRAVWPENYAPYFYVECIRCLLASPRGHTPKYVLDLAVATNSSDPVEQAFYSVEGGWMCIRCAQAHARGEGKCTIIERALERPR